MNALTRLATRLRMTAQGMSPRVRADKIQLIDSAYKHCNLPGASFADLGGVWGVDGAYSFYVLRSHKPKAGTLVDTHFNDIVRDKARSFPNLRLIQGNFGDDSSVTQVGDVDIVLMFDVLLHQVSPDWDEVLTRYSKHAKCFVILNQQWVASEKTVRLLELGPDEYFKNVPHRADAPPYDSLFEKLDQIHPEFGRKWRDIHGIWQWGITDADLVRTMRGLGFESVYTKNCGPFRTLRGTLQNFEDHAFVFLKR